MISVPFRARLALMSVGRYGFGDRVTDPGAFRARMITLHRQSWTAPLVLRSDPEAPDVTFSPMAQMYFTPPRSL